MNASFKLGIQSYTFRTFQPFRELVRALEECELSFVEIWPGHLSAEHSRADREAAVGLLKEKRITVDSYGQVVFSGDEATSRAALAFAAELGIAAITADVDPQAYELTQKLCDEYDVNLALHNHGRTHRYGTIEQLAQAFSRTGPRIGLCLDTGWLIDAGDDPLEAVDRFRDRLYGVHLKDFAYDQNRESRRDVIIGTGPLDLPAFIGALDAIGYSGYLSIEYEGDADNPIPNMKKCIAAAKEAISAI
ncbi:MAG: TIM barrel protein [Chitinivibrionales bacterium]|nr:TIM barrel protein [Chitinivibrionales bacterium]